MPPILAQLGAATAVTELRQQLELYWRGDWPFDTPVVDGDVLGWWRSLERHRSARVLAVSLHRDSQMSFRRLDIMLLLL